MGDEKWREQIYKRGEPESLEHVRCAFRFGNAQQVKLHYYARTRISDYTLAQHVLDIRIIDLNRAMREEIIYYCAYMSVFLYSKINKMYYLILPNFFLYI